MSDGWSPAELAFLELHATLGRAGKDEVSAYSVWAAEARAEWLERRKQAAAASPPEPWLRTATHNWFLVPA